MTVTQEDDNKREESWESPRSVQRPSGRSLVITIITYTLSSSWPSARPPTDNSATESTNEQLEINLLAISPEVVSPCPTQHSLFTPWTDERPSSFHRRKVWLKKGSPHIKLGNTRFRFFEWIKQVHVGWVLWFTDWVNQGKVLRLMGALAGVWSHWDRGTK